MCVIYPSSSRILEFGQSDGFRAQEIVSLSILIIFAHLRSLTPRGFGAAEISRIQLEGEYVGE